MSETRTISPTKMVKRWTSDARPKLFKRKPISTDTEEGVCRDAQGDVLHCAGYTDQEILGFTVGQGDRAAAKALGISVTHSVLLRDQNDRHDGCPQDVLSHPERIVGPHARLILAFWLRLDQPVWKAMPAMWDAAGTAATMWDAAGKAARATWEIQDHESLKIPLFFLPLFGINSVDELQAEADAIVLA